MSLDDKGADQKSPVNSVTGSVQTLNAVKYVQQLCKHWSHKLQIEQTDDTALIRFPAGIATMTTRADSLIVTIRAEDEAAIEQLKAVVASHLDRFAFREAPLPFVWSVIEGGTGSHPADRVD